MIKKISRILEKNQEFSKKKGGTKNWLIVGLLRWLMPID